MRLDFGQWSPIITYISLGKCSVNMLVVGLYIHLLLDLKALLTYFSPNVQTVSLQAIEMLLAGERQQSVLALWGRWRVV